MAEAKIRPQDIIGGGGGSGSGGGFYFGYAGSPDSGMFLNTANGIPSTDPAGYRMLRAGNLSGISVQVRIPGVGVTIEAYLNGAVIGGGGVSFLNPGASQGVENGSLPINIDTAFVAGDVLQCKIVSTNSPLDVQVVVEVQYS